MLNYFTLIYLMSVVGLGKMTGNTGNPSNGELTIYFDNRIGSEKLVLNTGTYKNASGESFSVSMLNYYITNIRLLRADGSYYTVPRDSSYFLIKAENPSQNIRLTGIPEGQYTALDFVLGIDSLKSTAPVAERTGVLDPAGDGAGMYWGWNSGYIFLKMEGPSEVATSGDKKFRYHIGGFGGYSSPTLSNIKHCHLPFPANETLTVKPNAVAGIHVLADASKVMNGNTNISIASKTTVMFSPFSVNIANNYASMFTIDALLKP